MDNFDVDLDVPDDAVIESGDVDPEEFKASEDEAEATSDAKAIEDDLGSAPTGDLPEDVPETAGDESQEDTGIVTDDEPLGTVEPEESAPPAGADQPAESKAPADKEEPQAAPEPEPEPEATPEPEPEPEATPEPEPEPEAAPEPEPEPEAAPEPEPEPAATINSRQ